MPLTDQTVVVLGATGVVGSGIVAHALNNNATVIAVSRSDTKLAALETDVSDIATGTLVGVVADFASEQQATEGRDAIHTALDGRSVDHVITSQGFIDFSDQPTDTSVASVAGALHAGLDTNFLAAKVLLPELKERAGASFTLVSGGLAHIPPPMTAVWLGTLKNAALNGLGLALVAETAEDSVRVNTVCIHFNVAPPGGTHNQAGVEADGDTHRLSPAFHAVLTSDLKGHTICLDTWDDAATLATTGTLPAPAQ